ncbi:hypothetical protein [Paraburkholderia sp. BCC1885]|uniref:hypothetical protein n=1 Tax=Paraburkholderia sp. BCC1885 TaxID=2562669 RepID=UPI00118271E1|nr:hypothetical protein [Paraburkholderia sp. BCC1885]
MPAMFVAVWTHYDWLTHCDWLGTVRERLVPTVEARVPGYPLDAARPETHDASALQPHDVVPSGTRAAARARGGGQRAPDGWAGLDEGVGHPGLARQGGGVHAQALPRRDDAGEVTRVTGRSALARRSAALIYR